MPNSRILSTHYFQDALSSPPAALAVRVPPQSPRILYNGTHVVPGAAITVAAGARATVVCEARYGNPPAYIEWFLEQERLTAWSQTNASEVERPRVWAARSVLELGAARAAHGRQLACRAHHPSYPAPRYRDAYTMLDVTFVPVVSITGADSSTLASLEEGSSALSLECKAEGNPAPYVWWTKDGQVVATTGPKLILAPISRNHSDPPRVTWVGPDTVVEASLYSRVLLECKADGNPPPTYQWFHSPNPGSRSSSLPDDYVVGNSAQLVLRNVTYAQHGRYACAAANQIGLEERSQQSEPITLNVLGPPVGSGGSARAWAGGEARVSATVCAEPPPRRAAWQWGSLRLQVPSSAGRHRALEPVGAAGTVGCYRYTLVVSDAGAADSRVYTLHVENERGSSMHSVTLMVNETAHVAPLIAAGLVIAALLVVVICLVIKCRRRRESVEYKTDDLDSEKTVLPADAVYTPRGGQPAADGGRDGARYSPGALQVRRAALVLQPPTTAALTSLEREAKENVYAVLDPHLQYEITINKHGEPPKYLSLSRPLTHQRTHAFDPQNIHSRDTRNAYFDDSRFSTFKASTVKKDDVRRSNRSNDRRKNLSGQRNKTHANRDVQYAKDPHYNEEIKSADKYLQNEKYSRLYNRHGSGRSQNENKMHSISFNREPRKFSDRSLRFDASLMAREKKSTDNIQPEKFFGRTDEEKLQQDINNNPDEYKPKPGKVKEIASKFNRNCLESHRPSTKSKSRPKPLQSYGNQAYLDHVFPDAVEI
ncbi:Kin of IRRE-like protein 3 [Eumeta japonica]|uniref:Kin of IRRE-like protein 3 n=1 Tax=Eumeta variegata TaxID=151549 RepID=A0A4C1WAT6_EUMVA|nr:Kin of IRRE-like protein 3 [Eumeta japonica]